MRNPHMKFQDSSLNGLKVTVCTKSVTHAPTNGRSKSNMPHQLFQSWGHNKRSFPLICLKGTDGVANSVEPDQIAPQGLHC